MPRCIANNTSTASAGSPRTTRYKSGIVKTTLTTIAARTNSHRGCEVSRQTNGEARVIRKSKVHIPLGTREGSRADHHHRCIEEQRAEQGDRRRDDERRRRRLSVPRLQVDATDLQHPLGEP